MTLELKCFLRVVKVKSKTSAYVRDLQLSEGDVIEVSMPLKYSHYANYITLVNQRNGFVKKNCSANQFMSVLPTTLDVSVLEP